MTLEVGDLATVYGVEVQYSLFECLLEDKELARMKRAVRRVIKPRLDNVRYYYLCATCQGRVETTMGQETTQEEGAIVV
jgi:CRISPR-associated protein Cas2